MRKMSVIFMVLLFIAENSSGKIHSWKGGLHIATAPLIAGSGIYSSVNTLNDTHNNSTRAAAISNLAILGVQASGGMVLLFSGNDLPPVVRKIHRIIGTGIIASGLWLSIAASLDDHVKPAARYTAYGQTTLAFGPLLLFSF